MLKAIFTSTILIASSASAGEIVWRSPVAGVLPYASGSLPTEPEPQSEEPAGLGVAYAPLSVTAGKPFSISPTGAAGGGYEFSAPGLPAGMILSPDDGHLVGVISAVGVYVLELVVRRGGYFERVSVRITVS